MALQSGKDGANGSGAHKALDTNAADELAENYRPSWAMDEDDDDMPTATAPAAEPAPAPAVVATPVVSIGPAPPAEAPKLEVKTTIDAMPAGALAGLSTTQPITNSPITNKGLSPATQLGMPAPRPPEPSSEALDSANVLEVAPAVNGALSVNSTQPMRRQPFVSDPMKPVAAAKDPFAKSALDSDEYPTVKKSNKGIVYVVVGLGIAAGLGLFLKFALSNDEPSKTPTAPTTTQAAKKENDIPPPPPQDEAPPIATTTTAAATATATATPPPEKPAKPEKPAAPEKPVAKAEPPHTVAAAPKPPKPSGGGSQPAAPKTTPKQPSGGIVRDSPF